MIPDTDKRLLHERRHIREAALAHGGDAPPLLAHAAGEPDEERQQEQ